MAFSFGSTAGDASVGTAIAPGPGTAVGAAIGAFTSLLGGTNKEAQREQYLQKQAAAAQSGNVGAMKLLYDWANGISATEYDGTNRGNEPTQSRQYAQQILLNLQKNGISYNPTTGSVQFPGIFGSAAGVTQLSNLVGGNGLTGLVELGLIVAVIYVVGRAIVNKGKL